MVFLLTLGCPAQAGTMVTVGARTVTVFEKPDKRSPPVFRALPQTELDVLAREGDWYWVVVPPDPYGMKRAGWVPVEAITDPRAATVERDHLAAALAAATDAQTDPVVGSEPRPALAIVAVATPPLAAVAPVATARTDVEAHGPLDAGSGIGLSDPSALATSGRRPNASRTGTAAVPPTPVGGEASDQGSALGGWIIPRSVRGSVTADFQRASDIQDPARTDVRYVGGGGTINVAFAVLDPRILAVDFSGDLQANRATNSVQSSSYKSTANLRSFHLAFGVLTGRSFPLTVYTDRFSADNNVESYHGALDSSQRLRGVRTGSGFSWQVNSPRLPRILVSASTSSQTDEHNYLFGDSSTNREQRAEIRASRDYTRGRYDIDFTHDRFSYDVPGAGVRSDSGNDSFVATGRLTPSSRLTLDAMGRTTRFSFGNGYQTSSVSGGGAGASVRYRLTSNVEASGRYSFSSNAFEAALSGQLGSGQPGPTPVVAGATSATRTTFQDGESRVDYTTPQLTAAVIARGTSFGVPPMQGDTLGSLFTMGGAVSVQRNVAGLTVTAGGDGSAGPAKSTIGESQPYREIGVSLGVARNVSGYVTLGVDGTVRRVGHIEFYPVSLDSRAVALRVDTTKPAWAQVQVAVTHFDNRRDVHTSDARDRTIGYSVSVRGPRYGVTAELNQRNSIPMLLAPAVLGNPSDLTGLVASRPDLVNNLLVIDDRSRSFGLHFRPVDALQIQARTIWQERRYPGLFGYGIHNEQLWATYQLRDVQLEFGWEYFDSASTFGRQRDSRIYFKVRRDVTLF